MSKKQLTLRSRIGPRGQVVVPQALREALNIVPNSQVFFSLEGDRIILENRDPEETLEELLTAVPDKRQLPRDMDWDREYYEQLT